MSRHHWYIVCSDVPCSVCHGKGCKSSAACKNGVMPGEHEFALPHHLDAAWDTEHHTPGSFMEIDDHEWERTFSCLHSDDQVAMTAWIKDKKHGKPFKLVRKR